MIAREAALSRSPAVPRPMLGQELLLGLSVFALYSLVASLPADGSRLATAHAHGRSLYELEQALHIDMERTLNHWLAGHGLLRVLANYEYAITYVISAFALLAWLYIKRPERYREARNSFVLINVIGIACFTVYPVAPPRFMPDLGFIDTVKMGNTWGSWGSPMVEHANQLAAVPSLHVAWTLWVGVEMARLSFRRWVQALNALHILVTIYVIMATANHFLLDAVIAVPVVWVAAVIARRSARADGSVRPRVPASDAFFLAVESPAAPQHVGGLVLLDTSGADGAGRAEPRREDLVALVQSRLDELPRFRQRLSPASRWRRPRWEDHPEIDWDWHVPARDLTGSDGHGSGEDRLGALVAEFQSEPLPHDRPLWRLVLVRGVAPGRCAVIFVMHHVVADGIGVVAQTLRLMEPVPPLWNGPVPPRPGIARIASGTAVGLVQLATDTPPGLRLPVNGTATRRFGTVQIPLATAREVAKKHGVTVSDVILCAVAGALHRTGQGGDGSCRITVPLMMRFPETPAEGNHTAAVMVDLPLGDLPETARLAEIARRSARLRTGTRALASRFVMRRIGQLMPPPVHARFARAVYGGRFFQAIVSNLPGPQQPLRRAGRPLAGVYPILPLAPGVPLAVGALGWDGDLNVGICADPALADDIRPLATAMLEVIDDLATTGPPNTPRASSGVRPVG